MGIKELVGVSWNIGAAQVADYDLDSAEGWSNKGEDVGHVVETLRELQPDFVTIQESHTRNEFTGTGPRRLLAEEIANALEMQYKDRHVSPSHVDGMKKDNLHKYWLSLAILSRDAIENSQYVPFPQPEFPIYFPGNTDPIPKEQRHEKGMLLARLSNGLTVVTAQTLPANFLGFNYAKGVGVSLTEKINERLLEALPPEGNIFYGGDLNYDERWGNPRVTEVFTAFSRRGMRSVFPVEEPALRVRKGRKEEAQGSVKTDYVFVSNRLHVIQANVIRSTQVAGPIKCDHPPLRVVIQRTQ